MGPAAIVDTVLLLLTVFSVIVSAVMVRPMVARARVGRDARVIEYLIDDAMLDGAISPSDPAYAELIQFSRLLSEHAGSIGLTEGVALVAAAREQGHKLEDYPPRSTYAHMTPHGRRVAIQAERDLHRLLANYLVEGSRAWWVLEPTRACARLARHARVTRGGRVDHLTTPGQAASGYRQALHEDTLGLAPMAA